ncbi:MAG: hypothetical protein JW862_07015 [Anaerolineales bacterium]|nr:hypothetical protein [Anaerolineales bacterium]
MTNGRDYEKPAAYLIRIRGGLDPSWSDWFNGFTITYLEGETTLIGSVPDQAALHGVLTKINDLGLALISVTQQP